MKLIVGLGNPGRKYADTKHNFGFWVADCLAARKSLSFRAGKSDYVLAKNSQLILLKPTSYMNNSGFPTQAAMDFFKLNKDDLLVIYDEIDLDLGSIRFRPNGSNGGHRGMDSIIMQLGTEKFHRLRCGIATDSNMRPAEKYVLEPFHKSLQDDVKASIDNACDAVEFYLNNGITQTMNQFN